MTKTMAILIAATLLAPAATASTIGAKGFVNGADVTTVEKRKKPRIKGGSGCDDPHDRVEHAECR